MAASPSRRDAVADSQLTTMVLGPGSIAISGDFEKAVELLLGQYHAQGARPVATLYRDPKADRRVLVVTTENKG